MKEIRQIVAAYHEFKKAGKKTALVSLVHLEGSSYRRPGARMIIAEDGMFQGAISGGCLEGDAMRKALLVITQQKPSLVTYDTMDEDDAVLGIGLGCSGIIQVLIEPLDDLLIEKLEHAIKYRTAGVLHTIFSLENKRFEGAGTHQYYEASDKVDTPEIISSVIESKCSKWIENQDGTISFYEYLSPPVQLVIAGAGNDVIPLIQMADLLGWDVVVVDGRPAYTKAERLGPSCQIILSKPENILEQIKLDEQTYFALMTHNYNYDKAMLHLLCKRGVRFIAMIGPKKKLERMLEEYADEGRPLTGSEIETIHNPAGLDIGAETSEEIALSIMAEIQAFKTGKNSLPLKLKLLGIHE